MSGGRGVRGNREVSPLFLLTVRGGDRHAAGAEATPEEGSEPQASDGHDEPFFSAHFSNAVESITTTRERISAWPSPHSSVQITG